MKNFKSFATKFAIVKNNLTNAQLIELLDHADALIIGYAQNGQFENAEFFNEFKYKVQCEIDKRTANGNA